MGYFFLYFHLFDIASVTKFGEISPLWQNLKNIMQLYEDLISIWQTFAPILENSVCF